MSERIRTYGRGDLSREEATALYKSAVQFLKVYRVASRHYDVDEDAVQSLISDLFMELMRVRTDAIIIEPDADFYERLPSYAEDFFNGVDVAVKYPTMNHILNSTTNSNVYDKYWDAFYDEECAWFDRHPEWFVEEHLT